MNYIYLSLYINKKRTKVLEALAKEYSLSDKRKILYRLIDEQEKGVR